MRTLRTLITWSFFLAAVGISISAAISVATTTVADRGVLGNEEVLKWLQTANAAQSPLNEKKRLAHRLDMALRTDIVWANVVNEENSTRVKGNIEELARVWFLENADAYARVPQVSRDDFISARLRDLRSWKLPTELYRGTGFGSLYQKFNSWLAQSDADERKRLEAFSNAIMRRSLPSLRDLAPGMK